METKQDTSRLWLVAMQEGQSFFNQQRIKEAARAFSWATRLQPETAEGWVNLGVCLNMLGELEVALHSLAKAVLLAPDLSEGHYALGKTLVALHRIDEAIQALEKSVGLKRTPLALNDLANTIRIRRRHAEALLLYQEATALTPEATLIKVNMATCLVEVNQYQDALAHLQHLAAQELPHAEKEEACATLQALKEFLRLDQTITRNNESSRLETLIELLTQTPTEYLQPDSGVMSRIQCYAESAKNLECLESICITPFLPAEWPRIEAFFMIPIVETVAEYNILNVKLSKTHPITGALLESVNMIRAIEEMQAEEHRLADAITAEALIRHCHGFACKGLEGFLPGHFKITQNIGGNRALKRAQSDRATGSVRELIGTLGNSVPAGMARALLLFIGILDIHPFSDGNGRIALTILNRELERNGLMPAIFPRLMGFRGELGKAIATTRTNGGDITPIMHVVAEGQRYAIMFCQELSGGTPKSLATMRML